MNYIIINCQLVIISTCIGITISYVYSFKNWIGKNWLNMVLVESYKSFIKNFFYPIFYHHLTSVQVDRLIGYYNSNSLSWVQELKHNNLTVGYAFIVRGVGRGEVHMEGQLISCWNSKKIDSIHQMLLR